MQFLYGPAKRKSSKVLPHAAQNSFCLCSYRRAVSHNILGRIKANTIEYRQVIALIGCSLFPAICCVSFNWRGFSRSIERFEVAPVLQKVVPGTSPRRRRHFAAAASHIL
jgi:hypothetical protein